LMGFLLKVVSELENLLRSASGGGVEFTLRAP
jgi:hypothetical protein